MMVVVVHDSLQEGEEEFPDIFFEDGFEGDEEEHSGAQKGGRLVTSWGNSAGVVR